MGRISQKRPVFRLKVRPPPGMSACLFPVGSHDRRRSSSFAALSILRTVLEPEDVHLHRDLPGLVLPFLFIFAPHRGHA